MASGRPIIAPNTPDLMEILVHEKNSLLVEPGDESSFIQAIKKIQNDNNFSVKLATEAKIQMGSNSWKKRAERIIKFCIQQMN